ncbi:TrbI/VirB10 family protein [Microvirga tunisiensis]|uniref:TrbI/VirB10 family protein n=3 Tax=Hyphomicrobiales TaxID=356 RepID=A0A5N7MNZ2_9HYPH|nr:TrbI/VirB10 family protein [Microvirga tunisiensis]MPR28370.1 TrbI/VirB10 family protein [Microvirga tunisiensis]
MLLASVVVAVGPTHVLKILGLRGDDEQKASRADLEVTRVAPNQQLDIPVPEPKADPNAEMNKRFEELRKQIEAIARSDKGADVSLGDVQRLLESYDKEVAQKLREERERSEAEIARLRAEVAAKPDAERRRQVQETETKKRESKAVILDEPGARIASADGASQLPEDLSANDRFLASAADSDVKTAVSRALPDPSRTIVQGTTISAVLETAINTELPGNIRALVIDPVYSFDGSRILLPAGTSLIGAFSNKVDIEQNRVLIAWNRAITPEGKSIALGSTGTDLLGRAGIEGNVDNRYGKKLGAAALISTITALPSILPILTGSNRSGRGAGTTITIEGAGSGNTNPAGQAASNIVGALSAQGKGILDKYLSLPPIHRVPQGKEILVSVNQDLFIR